MLKNSQNFSRRILQIGKYSLNSNGGIETVARLIHSNSAGLEVDSITFNHANEGALTGEISFSPLITFRKQPISVRYACEVIRSLQKHDDVIVHLPNIFAALVVYCFSRKKRLTVFWHADILQTGWYRPVIKLLEEKICRRARSVIYTSDEYYKASYSRAWVRRDKACVIPLGVPAPFYYKRAYRCQNDILNILFVGRPTAYKGLPGLVDAVRNMNNVKLTIVGTEADEISDIVRNSQNIEVLGALPMKQKQQLIAAADFLILPSTSRAEAFGLVLIEALAAGTPIITRYVCGSGMNEVSAPIGGRRVGYSFGRSDLDSLSGALSDAQKLSESEYRLMSDAAKKKYLKSYTAEGFIFAFLKSLEDEP